MKFRTAFALAVFASSVAQGSLYGAQDVNELLEPLRAALRDEERSQKKDASDMDKSRLRNASSYLDQLISSEEITQTPTRVTGILEMIKNSGVSPKVTEVCVTILPAVRAHADQVTKALKEEYESTLKSSFLKGFNATDSRELDGPLADLNKLRKSSARKIFREDSTMSYEELEAVIRVLTAIQDALLALESPDSVPRSERRDGQDPKAKLANALSTYGTQLGDLVPRSEFVKKMNSLQVRLAPFGPRPPLTKEEFEKEVAGIIGGVRKLDDVGPSLAKISSLVKNQREQSGFSGDQELSSQIHTHQKALQDVQSGAAVSLRLTNSPTGKNALEGISNLLVKSALVRVLGHLPDLATDDAEPISNYLQRALAAATSTSDWQAVSKIVDAAQTLNMTSVLNSNDTAAMRQFLAGVNYQKGQVYDMAVANYLSALKSGSQAVPSEKVGSLLVELNKSHPSLYEAGVKQAVEMETREKTLRTTVVDPRAGTSAYPGRGSRPFSSQEFGPRPPGGPDLVVPAGNVPESIPAPGAPPAKAP